MQIVTNNAVIVSICLFSDRMQYVKNPLNKNLDNVTVLTSIIFISCYTSFFMRRDIRFQ